MHVDALKTNVETKRWKKTETKTEIKTVAVRQKLDTQPKEIRVRAKGRSQQKSAIIR